MFNFNNSIRKYWKQVVIALVIILLISLHNFFAHKYTVPVIPIASLSVEEIAEAQKEAGVDSSIEKAKQVEKEIQEAKQKPPTVVFYTNIQAEADKKAEQLAKQDKADYIMKETVIASNTTSKKQEEKKQDTAENKSNGKITTNYYAITEEKQNALGVGVTVIDNKAYAAVAFEKEINSKQNICLELMLHSKDFRNIDGATALIKKKF